MSTLPQQKLPWSKKDPSTEGGKKWFADNGKYFIDSCSWGSSERSQLLKLYQAYNGEIDPSDYSFVQNPYSSGETSSSRRLNYPARIRNLNILKPVIDLWLGEKPKRYTNFQVLVSNSDVSSRMEEAVRQQVSQAIGQQLINELVVKGLAPEEAYQQVQSVPAVANAAKTKYRDQRAIIGQQALDFINADLDIAEQNALLFFHWLVAGECYTYKRVYNDNVVREVVSPFELDWDRDSTETYAENTDRFVRRQLLSVPRVLDNFHEELKDEDTTWLDSPTSRQGNFFSTFSPGAARDSGVSAVGDNRMIEVFHVCWKTMRKVGKLTYFDEVGQLQTMWVDETYEKAPGEDVKWYWVPQWLELYRLGSDKYVGMGPVDNARLEMGYPSAGKGPYNGRRYSNIHAANISPLMMGLEYQKLYNILHYRLELTIAKSKDKILLMELDAIPKRHGWDVDKFFYYMDSMSTAFVNTAKDGRSTIGGFNQFQVLDMSLGTYIDSMMDLLERIKYQWEESVGINPPRKGQTAASDGLGKTQQNIFQSAVITEETFRKFEKFEEVEQQGLLDLSKFAWKEGKKGQYITSDGRVEILAVEPEEYMESEFGVRVLNSGVENEKLQALKQYTQAFAQNGSSPSTIAKILSANNFARIQQILEEAEAAGQQLAQQASEAEQQHEQALQDRADQQLAAEQGFTAEQNEMQRAADYALKMVDFEIAQMKMAADQALGDDETGEGENLTLQDPADYFKLQIEREKLVREERQKEKDRALENQQFGAQLQQADKHKKLDAQLAREKMKNDIRVVKARPKPKPAAKK